MFLQWPPPKSIYLKTVTYSNYVGPLLWYAIFLSSPAIFDSWTDPPPLAHSCLLACCSWHHIQKSCSLSAVPSKEEGHQKAFFLFFAGFCRHEYLWTLLVFRAASGVVAVVEPLWLFVCKSSREGKGPSRFSSRNSPKVKTPPLIPVQTACSSSTFLLFGLIWGIPMPCHAMPASSCTVLHRTGPNRCLCIWPGLFEGISSLLSLWW